MIHLLIILLYNLIFINPTISEVKNHDFSTAISSSIPIEKIKKKRQKKEIKNIKNTKKSKKISGKFLGYLIGAGIIFLAGMVYLIYLLVAGGPLSAYFMCGAFILAGLVFFLIVLFIYIKRYGLLREPDY